MIKLASTEINNSGILISYSTQRASFWQPLLPMEGGCLFTFWDDNTNNRMTEYIEEIFASDFPVECALYINTFMVQLIGCRNATGNATIYWKYVHQNIDTTPTTGELQLKLLDFVFKNAKSPMQLIREDGSMYDFNDAMCDLLGYSPEEYKTISFLDTDPHQNKGGYAVFWNSLKKLGDLFIHRKLKRKDGFIIDVEISSSYIAFDGKELNCCFVTDVTDKKRLSEKLNIVNFAFQHAATPIFLMKEDSSIYDCNLAALNLFGFTKTQMLSFKSYDIDPNATPEFRKQLWVDLRTNGSVLLHRPMLHRNGNKMVLEIKANLVIYNGLELNCAFINDIAEKKELEDRLNIVDYLFQNASTAILMIKRDSSFYDFNLATLALFGYSREEMQHLKVIDLDPNTNQEIRKTIWDTIRAKEPFFLQRQMLRKDGTYIDLEIRANLLKQGDLELNCAFITDITERKKVEVEKQALVNELLLKNKELLQFSYITSHNLRAPVTNLITISKRLNTNNIEDEVTKTLIDGFKKTTILLDDTLNDLIKILIIKENTNLVANNVSFEEILENVKTSISAELLNKEVSIEADFEDGTSINFSNIYLESIFLNLLTNSIKYAHPLRKPIIKIKTNKESGGSTKLTFSDNGLGMNMKSVQNRIFGLYQRFHNNPNGKGVGLYLIHSQITTLGGTISVESEENVGTTFTIIFP